MKIQVEKAHYDFETYITKERFASYYYQLKYVEKLNPKSFLEIGGGIGFLRKLIPENIKYFNVDLSNDLTPNVIATVEQLPFKDNEFNLVGCFQVLEHLPFDKFPKLLDELKRVSARYVFISLPYANHKILFEICLPIFGTTTIKILVPKLYRSHEFDGQHYWEIGKKGYQAKKIMGIIKNKFKITASFTPKENTYHTFFLLEKR